MRLVGTYHGFRMCVFGPHSFEARDKAKGNRGGACGRSAGRIDKAVRSVPGSIFLIGVIKKSRLCTRKNLIILIESYL